MDEKISRLKRAYKTDPSPENLDAYVHALEVKAGLVSSEEKNKVQNNSKKFPCLICEKELEDVTLEFSTGTPNRWVRFEIASTEEHLQRRRVICNSPWQGIYEMSSGNYGSQVHDSCGEELLYFVICDECLIRHSHKMLHVDRGEEDIINARDAFELWYKGIKQHTDGNSKQIAKYFEE